MSGLTARQIAELRLPGLPTTKRKVSARAARECWPFTVRVRPDGRDTERVYPLDALPARARARIAVLESRRAEDFGHASAERVTIVRAVARLVAQWEPQRYAHARVAEQFGLSARTVRRYCERVRGVPESEWLAVLTPATVTREAECDPRAWSLAKSDYLRGSKPAFSSCYRRALAVAEAEGMTIPSERTLRRRVKQRVAVTAIVAAREGQEALERLYPSQERDKSDLLPMQAVNADGHRADVMVRWPDGEIARPQVLAWQDIASGKILSWRVDRTENQDVVRLSFADMAERYGIPASVYLDNGRAFASKWLTGGTATRYRFRIKPEDAIGALTALIGKDNIHWVTPYRGQAKPIERAWRDLVEDVSRHPAFEGAYVGSSPDQKPHNYSEGHAVTLARFLQVLEVGIREHNARTGRRAKHCKGRSFDQVFTDGYVNAAVMRVTDEQRRMLLLAAEGLVVRRETAALHLFGNRFWCNELAAHQGERVVARFDPDNVHAGLYVYTRDGACLGHAELQEATGFADRTAARDHQRKRKAWARAQKSIMSVERELSAADLAGAHLVALGALEPAPPPPKPSVVRAAFGVPRGPTAAELERDRRQDDFLAAVGAAARARLAGDD